MMCQRIGLPPISTIGLGRTDGFLAEPGAEAAGEDDGLHVALPGKACRSAAGRCSGRSPATARCHMRR